MFTSTPSEMAVPIFIESEFTTTGTNSSTQVALGTLSRLSMSNIDP
jgi:hypothetical protein